MSGIEDRFPEGLRVLVVDDNLTCLKILELLLQRCNYKVTGTQQAAEALKMLTENPKKYDIVITDVHMPGMDGFQLVENIGLHLDIPVIMLSANDDYTQVMRGIKHGAVDYLIKPVMEKELKNIWKHVAMRKQLDKKKGKEIADETKDGGVDQSKDGKGTSLDPKAEQETRKRKDNTDDGDDEDGPKSDNHGPCGSKRKRMVWTPYLHKKFVNAVNELGENNAYPKKILDIMNVEGVTREHVASHLQKYKIYLKSMMYTKTMGHYMNPTLTPFGSHESSLLRLGGPMFSPYGPFTNIESSLPNSSMGLISSFHPSTMNGPVLEQLHTSNAGGDLRCKNQATIGGPSAQGVEGLPNPPSVPAQYSGNMAQSGIPSIQDCTRFTQNWPNNNVTHATIQQNQAPPTNLNDRVSPMEISHLRNALEYTSMDVHNVTQSRRLNTLELPEYQGDPTILVSTSNIGDQFNQFVESGSNPYGAFANPTYGRVAEIDTSSGLQRTEAQDPPPEDELDALLNMDVNHFLDHEPDILTRFLENDNNH